MRLHGHSSSPNRLQLPFTCNGLVKTSESLLISLSVTRGVFSDFMTRGIRPHLPTSGSGQGDFSLHSPKLFFYIWFRGNGVTGNGLAQNLPPPFRKKMSVCVFFSAGSEIFPTLYPLPRYPTSNFGPPLPDSHQLLFKAKICSCLLDGMSFVIQQARVEFMLWPVCKL